jgi:hypothetical protein
MGRGCVAPQSDGEDSSWRFGINRKGCGTKQREPGKPQEDDGKSIEKRLERAVGKVFKDVLSDHQVLV